MKIFISWSKQTSHQIAMALRNFLNEFFKSRKLDIYLSSKEIDPGENWFDNIKAAISYSNLCIIVLTDENEFSRWIYFESGAIAFNTKSSNIIPFLATGRNIDENSPLKHYQCVRNDKDAIANLLRTIKRVGQLTAIRNDNFQEVFDKLYPKFAENVDKIIDASVTGAVSSIPFAQVFPQDTMEVETGKLFIGAPMAAYQYDEYPHAVKEVNEIVEAIQICCPVKRHYWAGEKIESQDKFDGEQKALLADFGHLKSSKWCVFILREKLPTSVYVEIGYAIALNKVSIIFCRSRRDLPFLLRTSDKQIENLSIYECDTHNDIIRLLEKDGDAIFDES